MNWQNWSGGVTCTPQTIATPKNEEELCQLVKQAHRLDQRIRVVGSGHSFMPLCASDDLLILLDDYQGIVQIDADAKRATVKAGTKIHQLGEPLLDAGLAMANMGDIDQQSIAGAISTGTHGTGPALGSISTQVVGLRLITATGEALDLDNESQPELFKAAQLSLGALGILSAVTLQLLPAYNLYEQTWIEPFDACMDRLAEYTAATRHFEFFWLPEYDACACKALDPTDLRAVPRSVRPKDRTGRLAKYISEDRIDASHRIFPSQRENKFNEIEFALPAEVGTECLCELRNLMQTHHPDVAWPIEYRTLAADDIPLSPAYGRESVTISLHQAADLPYTQFFLDAENIFRKFGGRPHWGKIHTHGSDELARLYPRWAEFVQTRQSLDPHGRFLNEHLGALFADES